MSGQKIIDGLKDAIAGNFARVTIDGQTWVRQDHDGWELIETAPFQTSVLLGREGTSYVVEAYRRSKQSSWLHVHSADTICFAPTHWMPLPEPPRQAVVDMSDIDELNEIATEIADYAVGERHNVGMYACVSEFALDLMTRKLSAALRSRTANTAKGEG